MIKSSHVISQYKRIIDFTSIRNTNIVHNLVEKKINRPKHLTLVHYNLFITSISFISSLFFPHPPAKMILSHEYIYIYIYMYTY